ncbi:LANO_0G17568g1_1 [Lachancea nothofagi CBS 11611]|uniref:LANO_0G17568g1_1 n=1 Tax=Lachancea nothofagi CBS 11611 TaxID=1266666 RepID=A0A1G4KKG7_9SACH|nr:LANO_0G17568g1_1 [Lachancea nothofagi CBS 11611]
MYYSSVLTVLASGAYVAAIDSYNNLNNREHANKLGKAVQGKEVTHLFRRGGTCAFPNNDGMVSVQSDGQNGGWAMSWDQPCSYGSWCPYACNPGQLSGQWDPQATSYTYPQSQYGGLYCDESGNLQKPISQNDYCYDGKGTVSAKNSAGSGVAFCQTVLPGNEEMLIPTLVDSGSEETLAVPGTDYWAKTASHFYINPPGTSVADGCKWGSSSNPQGNWSPYVAGANMDDSQNTFVKIGWNPVYLEDSCPFKNTRPSFGVRITCDDESSCNGLPCEIDPSKQNVNEVSGGGGSGAGGANFCVVTAQNGAKAKIEVFESSGNTKRDLSHHAHNKRDTQHTVTSTVIV